MDAVLGLAFNRDGSLLASAGRDNAVRLWDVATGRALGGARTHKGDVTAVAFAPDGRFASAGSDGLVKLWRMGNRALATTLGSVGDDSYSVAVLPGGLVAAAGYSTVDDTRRARLWSTRGSARGKAGERRSEPRLLPDKGDAYVVAARGDLLAVERYSDVAIWRVSASSPPKLLGHVPGNVTDIAISPDGTRLVTANLIADR